jgi:hypothetical protein
MEDPLLSNINITPGAKTSTPAAIGFSKQAPDDGSSLGLGFGGLGLDDESQSIRALDQALLKKPVPPPGVPAHKM